MNFIKTSVKTNILSRATTGIKTNVSQKIDSGIGRGIKRTVLQKIDSGIGNGIKTQTRFNMQTVVIKPLDHTKKKV